MPTITISRQFGSHGDTVAQLLCDRLDYRYFDKNLMMGLAVQAGLSMQTVIDLSEEQHRARTLVERLFSSFTAPMGDPGTWAAASNADAQQQLTMAKINHLIRAAYAESNVVIIGRGGQVILQDMPDVLHVRLIAPLELRIQRHQERSGLTPAAAREQVIKRDQSSADYVMHYFKIDSADPSLYDLILNTAKVTPAVAADMIIAAMACLPKQG